MWFLDNIHSCVFSLCAFFTCSHYQTSHSWQYLIFFWSSQFLNHNFEIIILFQTINCNFIDNFVLQNFKTVLKRQRILQTMHFPPIKIAIIFTWMLSWYHVFWSNGFYSLRHVAGKIFLRHKSFSIKPSVIPILQTNTQTKVIFQLAGHRNVDNCCFNHVELVRVAKPAVSHGRVG